AAAQATSFPGHEEELLPPRHRSVAERLLAAAGHVEHVVADEIEHAPHLQARRLDVLHEGGGERAVGAVAVERGLAMLRGVDDERAALRLDRRQPAADRA